MKRGVALTVFLALFQSLLNVAAIMATGHKVTRYALGKYPQHGLCYQWGKFNGALRPLVSGDTTVVWSQGPLPTPPWGGWAVASQDALQPGLVIPRHEVFAVLNAKFLSVFEAQEDATACNRPAAAIPVDHMVTVRLKRNMGFLTAQHRLRRNPAPSRLWCIEVVVHPNRPLSFETTEGFTNSSNSNSEGDSSNSSSTTTRPDIETVPFCFATERLQLRWLRALQSWAHLDKAHLTPLSASMADLLLLPELNVGPRIPFFPLPPQTICAADGFLCLQATAPPPPVTVSGLSLPSHGKPASGPMRYSRGMPLAAAVDQHWAVNSISTNDGDRATICLHADSLRAMDINDDMCLGIELAVNQEIEGPLPPVQFRTCHTDADDSDNVRQCFPLKDVELGEPHRGLESSKPCQEACDDQEDDCQAWTFSHAGTWNANVASCCLFHGEQGKDFQCSDGAQCCVSGTPKTKVGKSKQKVKVLKNGSTKEEGGLILASAGELGNRALWRIVEVTPDNDEKEEKEDIAALAGAAKAFAVQLAANTKLCLTTTKLPDPETEAQKPKKPKKKGSSLFAIPGAESETEAQEPKPPKPPGKQSLWLAPCGSAVTIDGDNVKVLPLQQTWMFKGFGVSFGDSNASD